MSGAQQHFRFSVENDKRRLVVPQNCSLLTDLIKDFHTTPIGEHSDKSKTYQRVASKLYWVEMKNDIIKYVHECLLCQQRKYSVTTLVGLLQPIPLPACI